MRKMATFKSTSPAAGRCKRTNVSVVYQKRPFAKKRKVIVVSMTILFKLNMKSNAVMLVWMAVVVVVVVSRQFKTVHARPNDCCNPSTGSSPAKPPTASPNVTGADSPPSASSKTPWPSTTRADVDDQRLFTLSTSHVQKQSLPVWRPTSKKIPPRPLQIPTPANSRDVDFSRSAKFIATLPRSLGKICKLIKGCIVRSGETYATACEPKETNVNCSAQCFSRISRNAGHLAELLRYDKGCDAEHTHDLRCGKEFCSDHDILNDRRCTVTECCNSTGSASVCNAGTPAISPPTLASWTTSASSADIVGNSTSRPTSLTNSTDTVDNYTSALATSDLPHSTAGATACLSSSLLATTLLSFVALVIQST